MSTYDKILQMLDEKIPRDVVSERDGGGGRKLSYLEGWYVVDRLNKIFGPLGWTKEIMDVRQVVNTTSRGEFPAYLVKVRLVVRHAGEQINYSFKEAYGYGSDKSGQNAHELAIKEAVTDALKVAAKDLGMSMGLALYDKSQENISDEDESRTKASEPAKPAPTPASAHRSEPVSRKKDVDTDEPRKEAKTAEEKKRTLVKSYISAAIKKGVYTHEQWKEYLSKIGADKSDSISDKDLDQVVKYAMELIK